MAKKLVFGVSILIVLLALMQTSTVLADITPMKLKTWKWGSNTDIFSVARGDVDADGDIEIITGGYYESYIAQLCVWDGATLTLEGVKCWAWNDHTFIYSVAVGDVDQDGKQEIVTGGEYYDGTRSHAQLCVWDGATLTLENVKTWYWSLSTYIQAVAVGDVDGDGQMEIVTGGAFATSTEEFNPQANAQLCVWDGATLTLENVRTWYWPDSTHIYSVAVGDVDLDEEVEIVTGGDYDYTNAQLCVWDGSTLALENVKTWKWGHRTVPISIALGDVDGDNQIEVVTGGYYSGDRGDGISRDFAQLCVWSIFSFMGQRNLVLEDVETWYWTDDTQIRSVDVGDVDYDGEMEIITGGRYWDGTRRVAQLCIWDGATLTFEDFTIWHWPGSTSIVAITVGDVNNNGIADIVTVGHYMDPYETAMLFTFNAYAGSIL